MFQNFFFQITNLSDSRYSISMLNIYFSKIFLIIVESSKFNEHDCISLCNSKYLVCIPFVIIFSSGITFKQFICIRSSVNLAVGQIRSSLVSSPGLWKNRMKRYSLKIGPMEPDGGQAIFSISRGIIGLPRFTVKFT